MNHIPHPVNHTHMEGVRTVVGSGWKEMGSLPRGNNCLPWLFSALSAPLGARVPQAAWNPSSAPQGSIRMNLDRVSARHALLESEELLLGLGLLLYLGDT